MKYALLSLSLLGLVASGTVAKEKSEAKQLLEKLEKANKEKDSSAIDSLCQPIRELALGSKDQKELDPLADELADSVKVCRGNWGTLDKVVSTLGDLRSKKGLRTLRMLAFPRRDLESDDERGLQLTAIDAIGKMRSRRMIRALEDLSKERNNAVAMAAYGAFKHYGPEKGRVRRQIVEILMKRISLEYPSQGGQSDKNVSAAKYERWRELQPVIVESLQVLCRQNTITSVDVWQEWWDENESPRSKVWQDDRS